jgi:hypothetical protein
MIEVEELQQKLGEFGPMLGTPEGAITYSVTQLVNFLREQKFDIPVKSTAEQMLTIVRDIAHDPDLHVKLLDKRWVRDLFRTFVAKSPDQEKIFNRVFDDAMQLSGKKSTVQVNDVMAFTSGVIAQKVSRFNSEYEYESPQKKSAKFFLSGLNNVLAKAGFDPNNDPAIIARAGKAEGAAILDSIEKAFKEAIISQIDDVLKTPLTSTEQQTLVASEEIPVRTFTSDDLTEEFVMRAIERAYLNTRSQNFEAAVTSFLYDQKAHGIAARSAKTGSSAAESNMLFGAFNEYLTKIHGKSIPNVYSFPFKEGTEINVEIDTDANKDALRLIVGELTWDRVKKDVLPRKYGNMIPRTMYIRALTNHVMDNLQNTGKMSLTLDELISVAEMWEQQDIVTEERLIGGEEEINKEDKAKLTSRIYMNAEIGKEEFQAAAYRGKTGVEQKFINAGRIILAALKEQNLTWTFKSGPNAGKNVKITTIKDLIQFARERRGASQKEDTKIDTGIRDSGKSVVSGRGAFLTRKDIRDLKELLSKIPDPTVPGKVDKLVGNGKFNKDLKDRIKNVAATSTNPAAKNAVDRAIGDITFSPEEIKSLRDKMAKRGATSAAKKLDSAAAKGSKLTRSDMDAMSEAMSQVPEDSTRQFWDSFKGSRIPKEKVKEIESAASRMEDDAARQKILEKLGSGTITARDAGDAMQVAGEIQDPSLRQSIQEAISSMKMNPADAKKIKDHATKAGDRALDDMMADAESHGGAKAGDIQAMNQAAAQAKDDKSKRSLSAAIAKAEFAGDKRALSDLIDKIPDKKVREKLEKLVGKKLTPADIAGISKEIRNASGNGARSEAGKALDGVEIEPENLGDVEQALDKMGDPAAQKSIKGMLDRKGATISGSAMEKILQDVTQTGNQEAVDDIQDEIDQQTFTSSNVQRAREAAGKFGSDPAMQQVSDMLKGADGKQFNDNEERELGNIISKIPDEKARDRANQILAEAKKNSGKDRQQDIIAGEMADDIADMEKAFNESASGMSRETYKAGKELIDFMKRVRDETKKGGDPSAMFGDMGNGIDMKMAITRLAKQGNIDNVMIKMYESMAKMFNSFSKNASTNAQQALFGSLANNMDVTSQKMKSHVKKVDLDPNLKRETDEYNARVRKVKEDADKLMEEAVKWYSAHGMDVTDVMFDKIRQRIRQSQEGSRLIPVPGSVRIVFDKKPSRVLCADFSLKPKRRLMFPSTEDVRVPSEIGGKSPTAFPDEIVNNAVDEYNATTEQMGNAGPGKGGGGGAGGGKPPGMRLEDVLQHMKQTGKKMGVGDVARDMGRNMMDTFNQVLSPQNVQKSTGNDDVEIEDPKEDLDIEGTGLPSLGNDTATGPGLKIKQPSMPFGGAGRPSPGGARAGAGAGMPPMPAPARGSAQSMCQRGSCGSRESGNRPGGGREVQVGLDGKPMNKGEKIFDNDTVVDHRKAGSEGGDPSSWYPKDTSPEDIIRRERERGKLLEELDKERQRKLAEENARIEKLKKDLKDPERALLAGERFGEMVDPIKEVQQKVADMQDAVKSGVDDMESEIYKPLGIMNPKDFLRPGSVITAGEIEAMLKMNALKPENAAMMRRLFQLAMRNDYSTIQRQRAGRRKLSTIDLNATMRRNLRHGKNPNTGRLAATTLYHRYSKNIKRDIFVNDISGSMHGFLAMTGQLLASLADPKALTVVLFDTDAVEIDKSVFVNNPASIFQTAAATHKFAETTVERNAQKREGQGLTTKWDGQGMTSYDVAAGLLSKMNLNKGDRIVIVGDLEHNTPHYKKELAELKSSGACNTDEECIAAWYANICKKVDSCMVINPKDAPGNDLTCEMLDYGIPTCLVGAMNKDQDLTGDGLMRTVQCLKMGMTGQRPRISERVLQQCKAQDRSGKLENRAKLQVDFDTFT